jgi:hypothetical protein
MLHCKFSSKHLNGRLESVHVVSYGDPITNITEQKPHILTGVFSNALLAFG